MPGPAVSSTERLELMLAASPESARTARREVAALARRVGAPAWDVEIAVGEAVGNAVLHAFRESSPGSIEVRAEREKSSLMVRVRDDGCGMRPNPDSQGLGMGLPLIGGVTEAFSVRSVGDGTLVEMRFPARAV
jgi:serine/threonine-protein kinase RsbW